MKSVHIVFGVPSTPRFNHFWLGGGITDNISYDLMIGPSPLTWFETDVVLLELYLQHITPHVIQSYLNVWSAEPSGTSILNRTETSSPKTNGLLSWNCIWHSSRKVDHLSPDLISLQNRSGITGLETSVKPGYQMGLRPILVSALDVKQD